MADAPKEAPKKYIRTLAGDIATVKAGGKPDLAPLKNPPRVAPPEVSAPAPQLIPEVQPLPPIPKFEPPPPAPGAMPVVSNTPETYSNDFSARVKKVGASTATVLAAEQDAARGAPAPKKQSGSLGSWLYVIGGIMLLLVGGGGAYYVYETYLGTTAPVALAPVVAAPIFVDERVEIGGTTRALTQAIEQSVGQPLAAGAVRFLYTENATSTDESVFSALQLPAPNILLRNVNTAGSMAGIVNPSTSLGASTEQSVFFILSVASYSDTFSGMLAWEPLMPRDLSAFFSAYPAPIAATTTATSTPQKVATSTPAFIPGFRDEVIDNHDARVYRDAEGRSVLLYGYWDQKTLVIARDPASFTELLTRLATSRSQQ